MGVNRKSAFLDEHDPVTESGITTLGSTARSEGDQVNTVEELRLAMGEREFFESEPAPEDRSSLISLAPPAPLPTPSPKRRLFAHSLFALVVCSAFGLLALAALRLIYEAVMARAALP
jgi:hypothetical protein